MCSYCFHADNLVIGCGLFHAFEYKITAFWGLFLGKGLIEKSLWTNRSKNFIFHLSSAQSIITCSIRAVAPRVSVTNCQWVLVNASDHISATYNCDFMADMQVCSNQDQKCQWNNRINGEWQIIIVDLANPVAEEMKVSIPDNTKLTMHCICKSWRTMNSIAFFTAAWNYISFFSTVLGHFKWLFTNV